jgi:lactate dehydrogenase-like 2-hydroxyacid dehydrogenase
MAIRKGVFRYWRQRLALLTRCMQPCPRSWLLENAKGASGILVMLTDKVDEELLEAAGSQLKAIASFSVGTDHVDRNALKERNVRLGYTPTCHAHPHGPEKSWRIHDKGRKG